MMEQVLALPAGVVKKAIENAEDSRHPKFFLGAVVFKGSRVFGDGRNDIRSFSAIPDRYVEYSHSLHAELAAILNCKSDISGASILVIREDKNGELKNARPCEWCTETLKHFDVKDVYYTNDEGEIVKERVRDL